MSTVFAVCCLPQLAVRAQSLAAQETRVLSIEEAFERFLESSPLVAAEKENLEAARGRLVQAPKWKNPTLNFSQEGYRSAPEARFGDEQEFLIWASQEFELGGKRGKRRRVAELDLERETADYRNFLRRKRFELQQSYVEAFYASQQRDLLRAGLEKFREKLAVHGLQYEAGEVSGLAQMKLETEELSYLVALAEAERAFRGAWNRLGALIGWDRPHPPDLRLDAPWQGDLPALPALIQQALRARPDLQAHQLAEQLQQARLEAEKAESVPDLTFGSGYKRDFGQSSFYFGVQLPLPLWDRREGAIAEQQALLRRQEMLTSWLQTWIRQEVTRVHGILQDLAATRDQVGPALDEKLRRTVEITALSYEQGEATIVDYLDSLRTHRDARQQQLRLAMELHLAQVELEASIATPLRETVP